MKHVRTLILPLLLVAGCGSCPPGTDANADNVRIIAADQRLLLATSGRSENEQADIRLHLDKAEALANTMREACK